MNLKKLALVTALTIAATASFAENINLNLPVVPNAAIPGAFSGGFGITHIQAGAFTDVLTFAGGIDGMFSSALITTGFFANSNIDLTSVSVNGLPFALSPTGTLEWASIGPVDLHQPFVITIMGMAAPDLAAGSAISASYAGTVNITPVPEPESYALMLAGLAALGFMVKRRSNS
nr:FxDxF family PEP-CTERM protein [uncultured Roseateles sp.]